MYDRKELKASKRLLNNGPKRRQAASKRPERKKSFETLSDIPVERVYTPLAGVQTQIAWTDLGFPGNYPYTRGVQPTMYRGRFWTMRQYAGFASAEESNKRYKYLLEQGQTGLSVAFDLPTQIGYDSDHPLAQGEVGKVGVAIDSLKDMETLFDGIPLDQVSTSMTINAPAAILLAMYVETAAKQRVSAGELEGHHPKRHPKGIRCPRDLHLPAGPFHADYHGHLCFLLPAYSLMEHHQHQRIPYPGGRLYGGPGGGFYPGQWDCLRGGGPPGGLEGG